MLCKLRFILTVVQQKQWNAWFAKAKEAKQQGKLKEFLKEWGEKKDKEWGKKEEKEEKKEETQVSICSHESYNKPPHWPANLFIF